MEADDESRIVVETQGATNRREVTADYKVTVLLRTMEEAKIAWDDRSGGDGPGRVMPSMWHEGSYVELESRLKEMRDLGGESRRLWWHVSYRYRFGIHRSVLVKITKTPRGPVLMLPPRSELIVAGEVIGDGWVKAILYQWDERVKEELAEEGVKRLVKIMYEGNREQLHIPRVFLDRALGR